MSFGKEVPDSQVEKAPDGKSLRDMTQLAEKAAKEKTEESETPKTDDKKKKDGEAQ